MADNWSKYLEAERAYDANSEMEARGSGVDLSSRAAIGFEEDIDSQAEMLRSYGYDSVRVHNGRLVVTDADSVDRYVDPNIFSGREIAGDIADFLPSEGPGILAEMAGGIVGGGLGTAAGTLGGPPGMTAGGVLGSTVGSATAGAGWDAVKQSLANAFGSPRKYDPQQTYAAAKWAGLGEVAGQGIGMFGAYKMQDHYAKNAAKYLPENQGLNVQKARERADELDIPTVNLPAEVLTDNRELLTYSKWGSTMDELQDLTQARQDAFKAEIELAVGRTKEKVSLFGGSHAPLQPDVGVEDAQAWLRSSWANAVQHQHNVLATAEKEMFEKTLSALPKGKDTPVTMTGTLAAIDAEIAKTSAVATKSAGTKLSALENMRDDIAGWKTVDDYLRGKGEFGPLMFESKSMGGSVRPIYGAILDDFRESAIAVGAHDAAILYDQARAIHQWQADLQEDKIFKRWWGKQHQAASPELNVRELMSSFSDAMYHKDPGLIKRWKQNVGAAPADPTDVGYVPAEATGEGKYIWNIFQQMAYDIMVTKSRNSAGNLAGAAFQKEFLRVGKPTLIELFGVEATQHMRALADLVNLNNVQKAIKANPPQTADALHSIQTFQDKIPTKPSAWYNRLSGERKTRRAVSKVILPSGSPGVPVGREYYLQGTVPSRQQIADGLAKRGIPHVEFEKMWRMVTQSAQRWMQNSEEDDAREKLTGFGGAQDATGVAQQPGVGMELPRPLGTEAMPGAPQPDPGAIGPSMGPSAMGPEPFDMQRQALALHGRPDDMPIAQYQNIMEGRVPERSIADKIWPGWDDIDVDPSLPPGQFDDLKMRGTGKMDTVPDVIANSIVGTLNAPVTIAEFSADVQSFSRKGLQVAAKAISNFPSFDELSGMIYDDATTAGGFLNTAGNIVQGITEGFRHSDNPWTSTDWERRQPAVEEVMAQTLLKTLATSMLSPDRITNEGLLVGLDGLASFGTVFSAGKAFKYGFQYSLSPGFTKIANREKLAADLNEAGDLIQEAIRLKASGDRVDYIEVQHKAYQKFAPAYIAVQAEMKKYAPKYSAQAPFAPKEGEKYANRITHLQKNVSARGTYMEDADALESGVFNYSEEGHPMGLIEHMYEATRDRYGPDFTAEQHLNVAEGMAKDLGINLPKGLKQIMANDRNELEAKYVFMQLANYRDYDWYPKLWAAALVDVGNPAHVPLWNGVWAILSPQNKAESNYADAFHMMTLPMLYFEQARRAGVEATRNGLRGYLHQRNFRGRDVVTNFEVITDRLSKEFPDLWERVIPGGSKEAVKMPARSRPKSKYAAMSKDGSPLGLHEAVNVANWRLQHEIRGQAGDPVEIINVKNPKPGEPKKVVKAYKMFRTKKGEPGKLFPLFIGNNKETPIGQWIDAEHIPTKGFAERSGWHVGVMPDASHLMKKDGTMADDRVWAEVEIPADRDWQSVASASKTEDIRGQIPEGGHYRFPRPAHQGGEWRIAGAIKVNKIMTPDEVATANKNIKPPEGARGILAGNPKFTKSGDKRRAGVVTVSRAKGDPKITSLIMNASKKEAEEEVLKTKAFKGFRRYGMEILSKKEIKREADAQKKNLTYDYEEASNEAQGGYWRNVFFGNVDASSRTFLPKPSVRHTKDGREVAGWALKMTNEQIDKIADYIFYGRFDGDYKTTSFWGTNETKAIKGQKKERLFYDITADVQYAKIYDGVGAQFDLQQYRWAQWQSSDMARKFNQSGIQAQAVGWGFSKYTEPDQKSAKNILQTLGTEWPKEPGTIPSLRLHAEEAIARYKQVAARHPNALTDALKQPKPAWDMGHDKEGKGFYPQASLNYGKHAEQVLQDQPRVSMVSSQPGDVQRRGYFKDVEPKVGALAGISIHGDQTMVSGKLLWDFHEELWKQTRNKDGSTTKFAEHLGSIAGTKSAVVPHVSGSFVGIENDYANTVVGGGDWGTILQGLAMADPQHQRAFVWYHPRMLTPDEGRSLDVLKADVSGLPGFHDVGLKLGIQVEKADGGAWTYDELKELHRIVVADPSTAAKAQSYRERIDFFDNPMNFSQTPDLTAIRFLNVYGEPDEAYLGKLWKGLEGYIDQSGIMLGNNKIFTSRGGYHEHDQAVGYAKLWEKALGHMGIKRRPDLYAEDVYHQFYEPVLKLRGAFGIGPASGSHHFAQRFAAGKSGEIKYLSGIFGSKPTQVAVPGGSLP